MGAISTVWLIGQYSHRSNVRFDHWIAVCRRRGCEMAILGLAVAFVVLAIIAAIVGQRGIAGLSMNIAKWLVIAFIILAIISMVI